MIPDLIFILNPPDGALSMVGFSFKDQWILKEHGDAVWLEEQALEPLIIYFLVLSFNLRLRVLHP